MSPEYRCLEWSGKNNHGHRQEASKVLASGLAESLERNPGVPHFVVAHSHGGNIAAHALGDCNSSSGVTYRTQSISSVDHDTSREISE